MKFIFDFLRTKITISFRGRHVKVSSEFNIYWGNATAEPGHGTAYSWCFNLFNIQIWCILVFKQSICKDRMLIRRWEGVREWGNRWMLASPGPWRLGVAVALRSRSPQTAAELARSGSIRFYSILFYSTNLFIYYLFIKIYLYRVQAIHISKDAIFKICALSYI